MGNITVNIESPVKYYDFKDQHGDVLATLKFVPSDLGIFDRHKTVYNEFEKMHGEIQNILVDGKTDEESAIALMKEYSASIIEKFDYLFNADTSGFFSFASPFTPMASGKPWALVILENVLKIIEDETGKNLKEMNNNSSKYTGQYHAAPGKYPFPV